MQKIPTLFVRDEQDRRYVTDQVSPGCEWVLAGEGVATRKYDGTCVMLDDTMRWWARREVKPGKSAPAGFVAVETDEVTGKTVGWEPVEQSSFWRYMQEVVLGLEHKPGTYELIGPKVNGNPEHVGRHMLVLHDNAERLYDVEPDGTRTCEGIRQTIKACAADGYEGVVWHHPDGRMAKLKVRDFPR